MPEHDELYTVARTVLLDALEALGEHREALVLVGAQAIYLRVGEADLKAYSSTGRKWRSPPSWHRTPGRSKSRSPAPPP